MLDQAWDMVALAALWTGGATTWREYRFNIPDFPTISLPLGRRTLGDELGGLSRRPGPIVLSNQGERVMK